MINFKRFSQLSKEDLDNITNKHYTHWVQFNPALELEKTIEKFKMYAQNDDKLPFGIVMFDDNDIIGFLVFKVNNLKKHPEFTPWIDDVMIYDNYRGKDYGSKMVNEGLKIMNNLGYEKIYLWTDQAPKFYEKLGFKYEQQVEKNEGGYGLLYSKETSD